MSAAGRRHDRRSHLSCERLAVCGDRRRRSSHQRQRRASAPSAMVSHTCRPLQFERLVHATISDALRCEKTISIHVGRRGSSSCDSEATASSSGEMSPSTSSHTSYECSSDRIDFEEDVMSEANSCRSQQGSVVTSTATARRPTVMTQAIAHPSIPEDCVSAPLSPPLIVAGRFHPLHDAALWRNKRIRNIEPVASKLSPTLEAFKTKEASMRDGTGNPFLELPQAAHHSRRISVEDASTVAPSSTVTTKSSLAARGRGFSKCESRRPSISAGKCVTPPGRRSCSPCSGSSASTEFLPNPFELDIVHCPAFASPNVDKKVWLSEKAFKKDRRDSVASTATRGSTGKAMHPHCDFPVIDLELGQQQQKGTLTTIPTTTSSQEYLDLKLGVWAKRLRILLIVVAVVLCILLGLALYYEFGRTGVATGSNGPSPGTKTLNLNGAAATATLRRLR